MDEKPHGAVWFRVALPDFDCESLPNVVNACVLVALHWICLELVVTCGKQARVFSPNSAMGRFRALRDICVRPAVGMIVGGSGRSLKQAVHFPLRSPAAE
eukprot:TRINITY_DN17940_c0_g1_i1.p2 TRINITY_DN17940_c0_g1~~TRINITY_DN17940_c0_g1_i1.p2  ORF type:complete len:100 (-),score=3.77 TRINITY_DN17940_c0_g1_i1:203-502(-)